MNKLISNIKCGLCKEFLRYSVQRAATGFYVGLSCPNDRNLYFSRISRIFSKKERADIELLRILSTGKIEYIFSADRTSSL